MIDDRDIDIIVAVLEEQLRIMREEELEGEELNESDLDLRQDIERIIKGFGKELEITSEDWAKELRAMNYDEEEEK